MAEEQNKEYDYNEQVTPFAVTNFRNEQRKFGIKLDDRRRHIYAIGKTGMGKTNLLENLIYSDIMNGHGCCYVDPHGDTAEKILNFIPASRINDVIYFNPADIDYPISFNVLEKVDPQVRHLVASGLIGVFKKLWADSWGPRLEYILRHAILALLDFPGSTMLGINRLLIDKDYRNKVVSKVTDPVVKTFWVDEYPKWNERVLQEVISPIQNKVGQFLSTSLLRNIVGQVTSTIDLRKAMDENKIIILNLSKGKIGEDAMQLLGSMIITKIQLAAMSRVDIPEEERKDFFLYVDELQNFVTESFANILSEARKYRLNLTVAHQYIEQLGEVVGPAIFGNVGTIITFRIGAADAEFLEKEFQPNFTADDLVNLPKYNVYLRLMIDGIASEPFSATTLPPLSQPQGNEEKIIKVSRERYSKTKDIVEDKIRRWSETKADELGPSKKDTKVEGITVDLTKKKKHAPAVEDKTLFDVICDGCGITTTAPIKPDGVRPVFCKDCLKKARRGDLPIDKMKAGPQPYIKDLDNKPDKETKPKQKPEPEKPDKDTTPTVSLSDLDNKTMDFKGKKLDTHKQEKQPSHKQQPERYRQSEKPKQKPKITKHSPPKDQKVNLLEELKQTESKKDTSDSKRVKPGQVVEL